MPDRAQNQPSAPAMKAPRKRTDPPAHRKPQPQNAHYACKVPQSIRAAQPADDDTAQPADDGTAQTVTHVHVHKTAAAKPRIRIMAHGPYAVDAQVPLYEDALVHDDQRQCMTYRRIRVVDTSAHVKDGAYHLCRCGRSASKPFCDGSHVAAHFDGQEVASRMPYTARADLYQGPGVDLLDDNRCAFARLCHRHNQDVWTLTEESGDPVKKELAVEAAWECPTGRLTSYDNATHQAYEEQWEPSVTILEDIQEHAAGPLFVRGGCVLEGAEGQAYENRNRYALCRCGASQNIPFCDAMHIPEKFQDDSPAWAGELGSLDDTLNRKPQV